MVGVAAAAVGEQVEVQVGLEREVEIELGIVGVGIVVGIRVGGLGERIGTEARLHFGNGLGALAALEAEDRLLVTGTWGDCAGL